MAKKDLQEEYKALTGNDAPDEMTVKQLTAAIDELRENLKEDVEEPQAETEEAPVEEAPAQKPKRVTIGWI